MRKYIESVTVCHRCKRNSKPLRKCKNDLDYVCIDCIPWVGLEGPDIGNQSKRYFKEVNFHQ